MRPRRGAAAIGLRRRRRRAAAIGFRLARRRLRGAAAMGFRRRLRRAAAIGLRRARGAFAMGLRRRRRRRADATGADAAKGFLRRRRRRGLLSHAEFMSWLGVSERRACRRRVRGLHLLRSLRHRAAFLPARRRTAFLRARVRAPFLAAALRLLRPFRRASLAIGLRRLLRRRPFRLAAIILRVAAFCLAVRRFLPTEASTADVRGRPFSRELRFALIPIGPSAVRLVKFARRGVAAV